MSELVSIIMPAYNAQAFIQEAIESVLVQKHESFELIVINDGSTDSTKDIILGISDNRIVFIDSENEGVSAARNKGLACMRGDYFMFLDADDKLPETSIAKRLEILKNAESVSFVDGWVVRMDETLGRELAVQKPSFKGAPLKELLRINGSVFSGLTWLVRRKPGFEYRFESGMTHAEDLLFYIGIADHGNYATVQSPVLFYRQVVGSAMSNIKGLENGYRILCSKLLQMPQISRKDVEKLADHCRSIIWKSHLKSGDPLNAARTFFGTRFI